MADNDAKIVIGADVNGALGGINRVIGAMPGLSSAIAGGFSIAAITAFVSASIDAADELNDLSQKTGIAVETLAGFKLVAEQNGTTLDTLARGVKNLSVYMVEHGDKLRKAGIDAKTADGALLQLSDVFSRMTDPVQRTALATELFGKAGVDLIPTLVQGSEALGDMIAKGQQLNPITTEMAKQADAFNDSMAELKTASAGAGTALANDLLPVLNAVVSRLNEGIQATGSLVGGINALAIGAMSEDTLRKRIADYEGGNEGGTLLSQYQQYQRELKRMMDERSAAIVDSLGPIDSREGRGRSMSGTAAAGADSVAAGFLAGKGGKDKAAKAVVDKSQYKGYAAEILNFELYEQAAMWEQIKRQEEEKAAEFAAQKMAQAEALQLQIELMNMNAGEREMSRHLENMAILEAQNLSTEGEMQRHIAAKIAIDEQYAAQKAQVDQYILASAGNTAAQFAQLLDQSGKKNTALYKVAFLASKGAQIANMILQTNVAAGMTYTGLTTAAASAAAMMGPAGPAYFAAAQAEAVAQAAVVKGLGYANAALAGAVAIGQTFGGSGGGMGGAAGSGTVMTPTGQATLVQEPLSPAMQAQASAPRQQINLTMIGDGFSYKDVAEKLIPLLNEAIGNGVDIVVNKG